MNNLRIFDGTFSHSKLGYCSDHQVSNVFKWDRHTPTTTKAVFTDMKLREAVRLNIEKKYAWLIEPIAIAPQNYNLIRNIKSNFTKVFTHEKTLLHEGEPYEFVPFGCCWIKPEDQNIYQKNKSLSIIASNKRITDGHKLRHQVINQFSSKMDVYGRGWNPIDNKLTGLKDYRFSVVIENTKRDYWFTEKLIDCLVTGTIPIYWGCPSIGNFFNIDGFIVFNDINELSNIINKLSSEIYNSKLDAINENFVLAKKYLLPDDWIYQKINNL